MRDFPGLPSKRSRMAFAAVVALIATFAGAPAAEAGHTAPHQCGVQSSSFARTCRPGAFASCLGAMKRGVAGFTLELCEKQKSACGKCLAEIRTCISRIGHWPELTHNCDACRSRFDICYGIHYPKS